MIIKICPYCDNDPKIIGKLIALKQCPRCGGHVKVYEVDILTQPNQLQPA